MIKAVRSRRDAVEGYLVGGHAESRARLYCCHRHSVGKNGKGSCRDSLNTASQADSNEEAALGLMPRLAPTCHREVSLFKYNNGHRISNKACINNLLHDRTTYRSRRCFPKSTPSFPHNPRVHKPSSPPPPSCSSRAFTWPGPPSSTWQTPGCPSRRAAPRPGRRSTSAARRACARPAAAAPAPTTTPGS